MEKITLEKVVKKHWDNFSILSALYSLSEKTEWDYKENGAVIEALRRTDSTLEKKIAKLSFILLICHNIIYSL